MKKYRKRSSIPSITDLVGMKPNQPTNFQVKRIHVKPGGSLSLQSHKFRSSFAVVEGVAHVTVEDQTFDLQTAQSVFVLKNHPSITKFDQKSCCDRGSPNWNLPRRRRHSPL